MSARVIVAPVRTMDPARPFAEAIAFENGRITAVGARDEVLAAAPSAERIDASPTDATGAVTVLPGFIDAHHHVSIAALYEGALRLDAPDVRDVPSLQAALARAASDPDPARWLVGARWDESRLRERRPPTRRELDDAVPDRPVFLLHHTCHRALANSRALELAGIARGAVDPPGGVISRGRDGLADGLLIERAMAPVETLARADRVAVDAESTLERMAAHYRALRRVGITRVCDTAVPLDLLPLYRALAERGELSVPTRVCPVSLRGWLPEPTDALAGPPTGHALGEQLSIGPVKLVFDGAPGCAMCLSWGQALVSSLRTLRIALRERSMDPVRTALSIVPEPGRSVRTGLSIYRREDAIRVVSAAVERGFSVATHAIGNVAITTALDAYERAGARLHAGGCPRIEHATFAEPSHARRMAALGVIAVTQPAMLTMAMTASAPSIPGLPFTPLRRLLDAGVIVAGSSDYPVHTFDPLDAIRAAVTRENARGAVVDPDERVSLDEAIAMYTRDAARALDLAHETGTLTVGKRADLLIVDGALDGSGPRPSVRRAFIAGQ